jgi:hypothetical protein
MKAALTAAEADERTTSTQGQHDYKITASGGYTAKLGLGVKWMFPPTVFGSAVTQVVLALAFVVLGLLVLVVRKPTTTHFGRVRPTTPAFFALSQGHQEIVWRATSFGIISARPGDNPVIRTLSRTDSGINN